MLILDHLAVAGETLQEAVDYTEMGLRTATVEGGQHEHFATHNRLVGMGSEIYLEAIATDPAAPPPAYARWFDLDRFSGPARLTNWIVATQDMDATLAVLGKGYGTPVSLRRGDLQWRMAVPETGILPFDGVAPAIIEWKGILHPAPILPDSGCRFTGLTVSHPRADDLAAQLAPMLRDDRIRFATGPAGVQARFDTAFGPAEL